MKAVVYGLLFALLLIPRGAYAAEGVLYVAPEIGSYVVGDTFTVSVFADSGGETVNAAEAELTFNPTHLRVESVSTEGSILTSWSTQPTFSNEEGVVKFSGWTKERFSGKDGLLVTITFTALTTAQSNAYLAAGAILAADGRGSNIITSMKSGVYTVSPRQVVPTVPVASTTEEVSPEALRVMPVPHIDTASIVARVGEPIVIKGKSEPDAEVYVHFARGSDPELVSTLLGASDGSFTFTSPEPGEVGVYRLWVEAKGVDGVRSLPSEKLKLTLRAEGLTANVLSGGASPWELFGVIGFAVFLLALLAGYSMHLHKRVRTAQYKGRY
jgi:hypothetical protein